MTEAVTPPNPAGGGGDGGARHYPGSARSPGMSDGGESKPDPTLLTIDALRREIAMLESLFDTRLESSRELVTAQFERIDSLMAAAEDQRRENKVDTKNAIDAALAAQKEATGKMEDALTGEINGLRSNFETEIRSIRSTQADLKDRMTQAESVKQGAGEQRTERRQVNASTVAVIGVSVSVLLAALAVIGFVT